MKTIPLKSKFGCWKCKERRKKCDERKPVCNECTRLGFTCLWPPSRHAPSKTTESNSTSSMLAICDTGTVANASSRTLPLDGVQIAQMFCGIFPFFDRPSILRTSAVPDDGTAGCKHIFQYLSERGTIILRYPTFLSKDDDLNMFRTGFGLASRNPLYLQAYLCMGAGFLSKSFPSYEELALKYYTRVMSSLRQELLSNPARSLPEWVCAISAMLTLYELVMFHSPSDRLGHLVGFHRLVESRIRYKLPWSPFRMLLEKYVHTLSIGSLFHPQLLLGQKSIDYVDQLIKVINEEVRPFGPEIVGIPEELMAVAYRLAFLNNHNIEHSPWDVEYVAAVARLAQWTPAAHTLESSATGLFLIAKLFQLACICLTQVIKDRTANGTSEIISRCLWEASSLIEAFPFQQRAFNSVVWPLTVLSIFALEPQHQSILKQPIVVLVEIGKVEAYRSVLTFLSLIRKEKLGPKVFQKPELLSMVHT